VDHADEDCSVYDLELLHKFAKTFPASPLTDFVDDYCRWFKVPLPEPEDEASAIDAPSELNVETSKAIKKARGYRKGKAGMNARERRKRRRLAGKEGVLTEDLGSEERDELVASMTVRFQTVLHNEGNLMTAEIAGQDSKVNLRTSGVGADIGS